MGVKFRTRAATHVVVGGGIHGLCTAYFLASSGQDVIVVERNARVGLDASGVNAGTLSVQNKRVEFTRQAMESVTLWQQLAEETGNGFEFRRFGGLALAETSVEINQLRNKVLQQRAAGLEVEFIEGTTLHREYPYLSDRVEAAAFCSLDSKANPLKACDAIRTLAERHGARVICGADVQSIRALPNGGFHLETSAGGFGADQVLVTGGTRISQLFSFMGLELPSFYVMATQVLVTDQLPPFVPHVVTHTGPSLTLKQTDNGSLLIGGGWPANVDDEQQASSPRLDSIVSNLRLAARVIPRLRECTILRGWSGRHARVGDEKPLLGPVPGFKGLFVIGCTSGGFTYGPYYGKITAALMTGQRTTSISADCLISRLVRPVLQSAETAV